MQAQVAVITALLLLCISVAGFVVLLKKRSSRSSEISPMYALVGGIFLALVAVHWPIYAMEFSGEPAAFIKTLLLSVHTTLRFFIVDGDYTMIQAYGSTLGAGLAEIYTVLAAALIVLAPLMTFGVVMSFFKNLSAHLRQWCGFFRETFVFSQLNDRSLALAEDIRTSHKKARLIFTDVFEVDEEHVCERVEKAKSLGAILFRKDVTVLNLSFHSKRSNQWFFLIADDELENSRQAVELIHRLPQIHTIKLRVFSGNEECELLLNTVSKGDMEVRRISDKQLLVSHFLYDQGKNIFDSAALQEDGTRLISAAVIGLGRCGTELTKALPWFCQMDGYRLRLHAFDRAAHADSSLIMQCPALFDEEFNHAPYTAEDATYDIDIHADTDVLTQDFFEKLCAIRPLTCVFVTLGGDDVNLQVAAMVRQRLLRMGQQPAIYTIVYDSYKSASLSGMTNHKGLPYNVVCFGDLRTMYSESVILHSDLVDAALERHKCWGEEETFWKYEYNYRSSIASVIHRKMKIECGVPGICKPPAERTDEELLRIRMLEHRRWNAYIRSEGYEYAPESNSLAKTHQCLVKFSELSEKEQQKDDF